MQIQVQDGQVMTDSFAPIPDAFVSVSELAKATTLNAQWWYKARTGTDTEPPLREGVEYVVLREKTRYRYRLQVCLAWLQYQGNPAGYRTWLKKWAKARNYTLPS